MIKDHPTDYRVKTPDPSEAKAPLLKKEPTPFPKYRLDNDAVIDDMLHTLREEENPAHE